MVEESKLTERIICGVFFGPYELDNFIVYESERWERILGEYVFLRRRVFQDRETGIIKSRSYIGGVKKILVE